ncbi:TPA: HEAT repeat domain-containing protein, partial [Candidatus Poribacteria bacterium]|nr:HEAT repeat domain-containing protein [Candidatus Poribacteria bacterium]
LGIWIGGCQTQEQKVEKLISKLQHKNPKIRQTAVVALTRTGKDAVPALIQALQDKGRGVRASAAGALGSIGKDATDATPALIKTLQDPEALKAVEEYQSRQ